MLEQSDIHFITTAASDHTLVMFTNNATACSCGLGWMPDGRTRVDARESIVSEPRRAGKATRRGLSQTPDPIR